jgi:hypothetical protein
LTNPCPKHNKLKNQKKFQNQKFLIPPHTLCSLEDAGKLSVRPGLLPIVLKSCDLLF